MSLKQFVVAAALLLASATWASDRYTLECLITHRGESATLSSAVSRGECLALMDEMQVCCDRPLTGNCIAFLDREHADMACFWIKRGHGASATCTCSRQRGK
jgi:hypothetical protein